MIRVLIIAGLFLISSNFCLAQSSANSLKLEWQLTYQNKGLLLDTAAFQYQKKELTISQFRCYLSNFKLLKKGKVVHSFEKKAHLLDAEYPESLRLELPLPKGLRYDALQYDLGIDSLTNISGALGGDLDPSKGMYWTWNSGYINFKLEGQSSLCPTRQNRFQLHLGGYAAPFASLQTLSFKCKAKAELQFVIDLALFLQEIDLSDQHSIMSPSKKAQELAQLAKNCFKLSNYAVQK